MKIKIREFERSDIEFITSTWLRWYKNNSVFGGTVTPSVYYKEHQRCSHQAIKEGRLFVICDPTAPEVIYSYLSGHNAESCDLIHFIYTKRSFRKMGLAMELVKYFQRSPRCYYTHESTKKKFRLPGYDKAIYNPYVFFTGINR